MSKFTLACDVGANGGFCLMSDSKILIKEAMPKHPVTGNIDWFEVERILATMKSETRYKSVKVIIEKVHAMPGNAAKSMHTFALGIGRLVSLLELWFGTEVKEVTPRKWQKWIFEQANIKDIKDGKGKRETKKMAIEACTNLFRGEDFRKSDRAKKPHDGICDAVLIAYYGEHNDI